MLENHNLERDNVAFERIGPYKFADVILKNLDTDAEALLWLQLFTYEILKIKNHDVKLLGEGVNLYVQSRSVRPDVFTVRALETDRIIGIMVEEIKRV